MIIGGSPVNYKFPSLLDIESERCDEQLNSSFNYFPEFGMTIVME